VLNFFNGIIFFVVIFCCCAAASSPTKITGIYSNIYFNESSGDLLGVEVLLLKRDNKYYVVFQSAQGEAGQPILVAATLKRNKLNFTLPESNSGYSGMFEGVISTNKMEGGFVDGQLSSSGEKIFILKKGNGYWKQD
jgi:hypothetical protein